MGKISSYHVATAVTDDNVFIINDGSVTKQVAASITKTYFARTVRTPEQDGAIGDGRGFTFNTTASSTTLTSPAGADAAVFTAGDTGKTVWLPGAGAAGVLKAVVITFATATTATMTSAASTSVTGGKGTVGTNDTTALQTWLNRGSATVLNQATVGKVYIHDAVLTTTAKTGQVVDLTGAELRAVVEDASQIRFYQATDLTIIGGTLRVGGLSSVRGGDAGDHKLYIDESSRVTLRNVFIANSKAAGIYTINTNGFIYDSCHFENTLADGCHIVNGSRNGLVMNCTGINVGDDTISLVSYNYTDPATIVRNVHVFNCRSFNPTPAGRGFTIVGADQCGFNNCDTYGSRQAGFYIAHENDSPNHFHNVTRCYIKGGIVKNAVRDPAFDHGAVMLYNGISGTVMDDVLIEGVEVVDSGSAPTAFAGVRVGNTAGSGGTFNNIRLGTTDRPIRLTGTYWGSGTQYDTLVGITTNVELGSRTSPTWLIGYASAVDPASIASNAAPVAVGTVTVTGAAVGDVVVGVTHDGTNATSTGLKWWGHVTAANTVTCYLQNNSAGAINVGSGQLNAVVSGI